MKSLKPNALLNRIYTMLHCIDSHQPGRNTNMSLLNEPIHPIAQDAIKVWRISNTISQIIIILVGLGLIVSSIYFDWYRWIQITLIILLAVDMLMSIWDIFIEPTLLQKYWRYDVNSEYVQMKHGIFKVKHIIAPMTKVQYVNTEQGPILRKYNLYTVEIGTMSSSFSIPALPEQEALRLRSQIAEYAKIKEVENV